MLLAAGAGAGLATAFNAPIAGAIFVLEELDRRFEPRIAIAALGASATAIAVSRVLLGNAPDFHVEALNYAAAETRPLYFVLGAVAGLMAIVYNRSLLATMAAAAWLVRAPVELRAALIGAAIGALAWFGPDLVGGGDTITQAHSGRSRDARHPSPCLPAEARARRCVLRRDDAGRAVCAFACAGGATRLVLWVLSRLAFPDLDIQPEGFAVVGMAAFFTGVVRAPLTGIVLVTEMTANVTMLLPMLGACFAAMLVPTLLSESASLRFLARKHSPTRRSPRRQDSKRRPGFGQRLDCGSNRFGREQVRPTLAAAISGSHRPFRIPANISGVKRSWHLCWA